MSREPAKCECIDFAVNAISPTITLNKMKKNHVKYANDIVIGI